MADGEEADYVYVARCVEGGNVYRNTKTGEKVFTNKMAAIKYHARVYPFADKEVDDKKKVVIE